MLHADDPRHCDVCGNTSEVGIYGSSLGPASFAYCKGCIRRNAEPLWMVMAAIFRAGGLANAELKDFADLTTFHNGDYRSIEYISGQYPEYEDAVGNELFGD